MMGIGSKLQLPPEFSLAIECCGSVNVRRNRISDLAQVVDWTRFLATCRRHRIQGLVRRALLHCKVFTPDDFAARLTADTVEIAKQGLLAANVSLDLLKDMTASNIPILFVKGLTLSQLAYGDAFVKMSHDIDILVPIQNINGAAASLARRGYCLARPQHQDLESWHLVHKESVWVREGHPSIDLHSRLADNDRLMLDTGRNLLWQHIEVAPGIILPTLASDQLIAYLCVHGASSAWFRLKWIADLSALLARYNPADIDLLARRIMSLGAGRSGPVAFGLARDVFGVALGPETERASATPVNRWLAAVALRELVDPIEPTQRRFGTAGIHISQLFLMRGLAFKISETLRQFRTAFTRA